MAHILKRRVRPRLPLGRGRRYGSFNPSVQKIRPIPRRRVYPNAIHAKIHRQAKQLREQAQPHRELAV